MQIDYTSIFRDPRGRKERRENLELAGATWFLNQRDPVQRRRGCTQPSGPWWLMRNYVKCEFEIGRPVQTQCQ